MQENITANVSEDTITLEFLRLDGVHVSQLVDFTNVSVLYCGLMQNGKRHNYHVKYA